MAGFIYFKPGHSSPRVTMQNIADWGLSHALDVEPTTREVSFPEVGKGMIFGDESRLNGMTIGLHPDEQTWRKIPGSECHVGLYNDARPTPSDLLRRDQFRGYNIALQDGNSWAIPAAVQVLEGEPQSNLPCKLDVDDEGKICDGEPLEKYRYLWELTEPYADVFLHGSKNIEEIDSNDLLRDAVSLLAVNYRVGLAEVILLELFTANLTEGPLSICLAAIDYPTWADWQEQQKKTTFVAETAGYSTADGKTDSLPATAQLVPTS